MAYIYSLHDPITDELRYIGKTKNVDNRLKQHINEAKYSKFKSHKISWIKSLLNKKLLPKIIIIEEVDSLNVDEREIYHITKERKSNDKLTNMRNGGGGGVRNHKIKNTVKYGSTQIPNKAHQLLKQYCTENQYKIGEFLKILIDKNCQKLPVIHEES